MELKPYSADQCEGCGRCLAVCRELKLTEPQAREEIKRLRAGDLESVVLKKCVSCFECNNACPNDNNVHGLILSLWHQTRPGMDMPWHMRLCLPEQREPNAWDRVRKYFTPAEHEILGQLDRDVTGQDVLFLGCNQLLDPYVADSSLLNSLPTVAAPGVCCGEMYFRMGFMDRFEVTARNWLEHWTARAPRRMVVFCTACLNMFQNVYPAYIGKQPPFEIVGLLDWLAERADAGAIKITKPVDLKLTVQDSCHANMLDPGYRRQARNLMELAGAKLIETSDRGSSDCCGFAGAIPGFSPAPMYRLGTRALKNARDAGADGIGAYCNGCVLLLSMTERLSPLSTEVYHLIELLELATGASPDRRHRRRAREIMFAVAALLAHKLPRPSQNVLE